MNKNVRILVLDIKIMYMSSQTVPGNHELNISSTKLIIRAARRSSLSEVKEQMRQRDRLSKSYISSGSSRMRRGEKGTSWHGGHPSTLHRRECKLLACDGNCD